MLHLDPPKISQQPLSTPSSVDESRPGLSLSNHEGTWLNMGATQTREMPREVLEARSQYITQSLLNSSAWQRAQSTQWVASKRVETKLQRSTPAQHLGDHAALTDANPLVLARALHLEDTLRWLGAPHKSTLGQHMHKTGMGWGCTILDKRGAILTHAHRVEMVTPKVWAQHIQAVGHHPSHHLSVLGVGAGLAGVYPQLLNEAGVFVTVHPHSTPLKHLKAHPPRAGVLLDALSKSSTAQALAHTLQASPWASGATLVISDASGCALVMDKGQDTCTITELTQGLHIITAHDITSTSARESWSPVLASHVHASRSRSQALHRHLQDAAPQDTQHWVNALCDRTPERFLEPHTPLPSCASIAVLEREHGEARLWVNDAPLTQHGVMRPVGIKRAQAHLDLTQTLPLPEPTIASRASHSLMLAAQSIQRGDTRRALTHVEFALALYPYNTKVQTLVALCAMRACRWSRAEGALRTALTQRPSAAWSAYINLYLAWALHAQNQPLAAKHIYIDLRQSVHLAPRHATIVAQKKFPSISDLMHIDIDFLTLLPIS